MYWKSPCFIKQHFTKCLPFILPLNPRQILLSFRKFLVESVRRTLVAGTCTHVKNTSPAFPAVCPSTVCTSISLAPFTQTYSTVHHPKCPAKAVGKWTPLFGLLFLLPQSNAQLHNNYCSSVANTAWSCKWGSMHRRHWEASLGVHVSQCHGEPPKIAWGRGNIFKVVILTIRLEQAGALILRTRWGCHLIWSHELTKACDIHSNLCFAYGEVRRK
jgi:hypothetical protein